jgi:hypothetical protein
MTSLSLDHITPLQDELERHPVYGDLQTLDDLRLFMNHHVYSVWDFMSLVKYLQNRIAPAQVPWLPTGDPALRYFINQLVLEEESDQAPGPDGRPIYASHFEHYLSSMEEIGADTQAAREFLELVKTQGVEAALESEQVPEPARRFSQTTFCIINENQPHLAAAALAAGRERIIPAMFRRFLEHSGVDEQQAPAFHYYLNRHIHLDEDFHAPLSMRLLEVLCEDDPQRLEAAEAAAEEAIWARIRFWDGVHEAIKAARDR